jgi:hypothetical protein
MNKILYGVGNAVLRDFSDTTKIVAFTKLKDLSIETSANEEKVFGGDNPYALASFPKDKAIKVSAENAAFDMAMLNVTQGAAISTGKVIMTEIIDVVVPDNGELLLDFTPIDNSVILNGFTKVDESSTPATGQYKVDDTNKKLIFAVDDVGKEVSGLYERESSINAETLSVMKDTLAKPFKFIHRIPIYDTNNAIVAHGQLVIFKCKANNSFKFALKPQTAFAPKILLEAQDPMRADKKLWDFIIDPVA